MNALDEMIAQILRCHPEERRAKVNRMESYALEFERWADQGDKESAALYSASRRMLEVVRAIRMGAN